jgi:RNA polymerase sigma-70 factor (ECF subfamily)
MGYTNDAEQAKDLMQETFIAVWQNLGSFRGESNISTWIFRIATNNCLKELKKLEKDKRINLPDDLPHIADDSNELALNFLHQCIAELEATEKIIISLVLEGLPQTEIASIVGLSDGNTRVKIHRIKEKLSKKFKAHGQFR